MDMEWNQALTYSEMVKDPVFLTGEIIQIGAIKLNQALEVVDSFNERIVPQYYTELHPKVAEITKLSNRDLQKGKGFHTVFNSFCDWCGDDFVFLVWGTEDFRILRKNMDLHNIDTSFMPPCFNLQNIFVDQVTHDTKQYALANALAIVGEVPFDSHDALNDARSTALLCTHLDLIRGLNEYKETVENRNGIVESYEFEEPYADIGEALSDDYVVSFECPHCGEIVWGENWIRKTGTNLLSLSQCSDGQEYLISEYCVRGCTALLDAIGDAIHHIGNVHKYAREEDVPAHTLFVITTDGMENASRLYDSARVKQMIEHEKSKYGWEFLFLGANIDAVETAKHFGISEDRAVNYHSDSVGTRLNYEVVSCAITSMRRGAPMSGDWKAPIEADYKTRKGEKN